MHEYWHYVVSESSGLKCQNAVKVLPTIYLNDTLRFDISSKGPGPYVERYLPGGGWVVFIYSCSAQGSSFFSNQIQINQFQKKYVGQSTNK